MTRKVIKEEPEAAPGFSKKGVWKELDSAK